MAKDDEKYRWDWGTQTFPTIDPHSKIKHQIIDEYIQTYIDVLMRNQLMPELGLSIVDADVVRILGALGLAVVDTVDGWQVTPPPRR